MKKNKRLAIKLLPISVLVMAFLPNAYGLPNMDNSDESYSASALPQIQSIYFNPVLRLEGWGGRQIVGKGQLLVPFHGSMENAFYGVLEGNAAKREAGWMLGAGLGYRQVINDRILGGYLLADYNRSPLSHGFWIFNPGIESLGEWVDFRINGYVPINSNKWNGPQTVAEDLGIYDYAFGRGHGYFDSVLQTYEEVGTGVDAEVGVAIPRIKGLKVYLGAYNFSYKKNGSFTGTEERLAYELNNNVAVEVRHTYDKFTHNTVMVGLKFSLGGFSAKEKDALKISGRLLDPIEHNFATAASGYGTPIKANYKPIGGPILVLDKVWYFKPGTTTAQGNASIVGNGTAENPYVGFSSDMVTHIVNDPDGKDYANLFFQPGTYNLANFTNARWAVPNGFSVFGRATNYTSDYKLAGQGTIFIGGIDLNYGNNTLDHMTLYNNDGAQTTGLIIGTPVVANAVPAVSKVTLNNVTIGTIDSTQPNLGYDIALAAYNAPNVTLQNNNKIYSLATGTTLPSVIFPTAISLTGGSTLNVIGNNNDIATYMVKSGAYPSITCYTILANGSNVNFSGNNNNVTLFSRNATIVSSLIGVNLTNSNFTLSGNNNNFLFDYSTTGALFTMFRPINSTITISGNTNYFKVNALTTHNTAIFFPDQSADHITTITINGNYNSFVTNMLNTTPITGDIPIGFVFQTYGALGTTYFNLTGNNNLLMATAKANLHAMVFGSIDALGHGDYITISGNNNKMVATTDTGAALGMYLRKTPYVMINGKSNTFDISSLHGEDGNFSSGIYITDEAGGTGGILKVFDTIFNVTNGGDKAHGVYVDSTYRFTNTTDFVLARNAFNVIGAKANSWGVFNNNSAGSSAYWGDIRTNILNNNAFNIAPTVGNKVSTATGFTLLPLKDNNKKLFDS